jgi:hypothetical protein
MYRMGLRIDSQGQYVAQCDFFSSPSFDQYFDLHQRLKEFAIEQPVSKLVVEVLDVTIFPEATGLQSIYLFVSLDSFMK